MPATSDIPGLHLVDLDQDLEGQRRFIGCWVGHAPLLTYVVDPGPPATAERLLRALDDLGVTRLDLILLTHIHLDHGGATARLLARWPRARVHCHGRGRDHLVDPTRLWEGSLQVLGTKARVYGEPAPVPRDALVGEDELAAHGIAVVPTPGHAPHHVCFRHEDRLFLGEAAGTYSTLGRGPTTREPYLRPATPPRFRPEVAADSLDRLLALRPLPRHLLFAHHGRWTGDAAWLLGAAREQLDRWVRTAAAEVAARGGLPDDADEEAFFDAVAARLTAVDPFFARGRELPADIRRRERDFTRQSLRGVLGHLRASAGA